MTIKNILNVTAQAAAKLTARILGYTVFGIALNLVFLVVLFSAAGRSSSGKPLMLLVLVCLVAPVFYFLTGKKQGAFAALHFLAEEHSQDLGQLVLTKIADTQPQLFDSAHTTTAVINEKLSAVMNKLSEQSTINKAIFGGLLERLDFINVVTRVLESHVGDGSGSREEKIERMAGALKAEIKVDQLKPDMRPVAKLVGYNLAASLVCAAILPMIFR